MRFAGIWVENDENNKLSTVEQFYGSNLQDFMGYHFRVATNPWSHHVQAASARCPLLPLGGRRKRLASAPPAF